MIDRELLDFGVRIFIGVACGSLLGFERQMRGKPVGIRTSTLIVVGTIVFMEASTLISTNPADLTRTLGQVITGVGFLGAGVMLTRDGIIYGVTSAAVIWLLAGIGISIGLGHLAHAIFVTVLSLVILIFVERLERALKWLQTGVHKRIGPKDDKHY